MSILSYIKRSIFVFQMLITVHAKHVKPLILLPGKFCPILPILYISVLNTLKAIHFLQVDINILLKSVKVWL